ncbi:exopolysaccharide biosynthesis polyprenyl glycosylphosphotransferase [Dictyobacter kobayashii]|uniref:Bacterial sugar transferase domain-containing protein n=1 Tax=Dictyobacter kobayashii TaxID=2014872 RepID=A0A402APR4_9CHLR|nr:exopolysaccharide biosynthesis polyprenyl glycosylphosphotransferase [Dictyobacter kobayashii]GCE21019.1 hypothetical protein KDK_48190 [Dictyobacter kobayashii]
MIVSRSVPFYDDHLLPRKRRWTARHWRWVLAGGDTLVFLFTLFYVLFLASTSGWNEFRIVYDQPLAGWRSFFCWEVLGGLAWLVSLRLARPYARFHALSYCRGVLTICCSLGAMLACWLLFLYTFFQGDLFACLSILLPFAVVLFPIFGLWRACYVSLLKFFLFQPLTVVVGADSLSDAMLTELCQIGQPAPIMLGYIDEYSDIDPALLSWPVLGGNVLLHSLVQADLVDLLVVAPDCYVDPTLYPVLMQAMAQGVQLFSLPDLYECTSGKYPLLNGTSLHMLMEQAHRRALSVGYHCWRRLLDLCFGVVGLAVLLGLLPLLAVCIYLDSPGPVFYWQERVGYHGRCFRLLKFRSMRVNAEPCGATWASQGDARVTRVGRVLRATHLDELPQVINILQGEMSLIGPRPERPMFELQLEQILPAFCCRLGVKPGLTGWAQVKAPYASSYAAAAVKLQYDLYYIRHQSFVLDISILLKTIVAVLWCSGR